jgi:hypothetical protein
VVASLFAVRGVPAGRAGVLVCEGAGESASEMREMRRARVRSVLSPSTSCCEDSTGAKVEDARFSETGRSTLRREVRLDVLERLFKRCTAPSGFSSCEEFDVRRDRRREGVFTPLGRGGTGGIEPEFPKGECKKGLSPRGSIAESRRVTVLCGRLEEYWLSRLSPVKRKALPSAAARVMPDTADSGS